MLTLLRLGRAHRVWTRPSGATFGIMQLLERAPTDLGRVSVELLPK